MLQPNCTCLENHNDLMLLPDFSIEEPAGKSVLLPRRHIEGCSFWKKTVLVKSDEKKHVERWATLFCLSPAVHGKVVCGDHEGVGWLSLLSTYSCTLKWLAKEFPFLSACAVALIATASPKESTTNKQKTSKKPQQIIQLEFFHWYESFPVIKLQSKCCSLALTNDCFMTVL